MAQAAVPSSSEPAAEKPPFEQAFKELEETVRQLEQGELDLEASITLFERGMELAGYCEELLDQAELKVEELLPEERPGEEPAPPADAAEEG